MIKMLARFLGDPGFAKSRRVALYAALVVVLVADLLVPHHHAVFRWERWLGFSAGYGLVSCILIIVVSKFLGHQGGLMKREDFYDD